MAKSGQEWPGVARSGQTWPGMARFKEDLRNPSFWWEKVTEECIKNAFIACGIVDKHGPHDVEYSFLFSSGFFCLKTSWNGHFGQLIDRLREKQILNRFEPFWAVSDRVGYNVLVGLEIDLWRRDGRVMYKFSRDTIVRIAACITTTKVQSTVLWHRYPTYAFCTGNLCISSWNGVIIWEISFHFRPPTKNYSL